MSENEGEYDKSDPQLAEKLRLLGEMNAEVVERFTCWQDMYDHLKWMGRTYLQEPSKGNADYAITHFLSFLGAMELLPDEGDIVQIAKKLNEVLLLRPDLTGIHVHVGEGAEAAASVKQALFANVIHALLGSLSTEAEAKEEEPEEEKPALDDSKRMLH